MKTLILLLILLVFSFNLEAQDIRSSYTIMSTVSTTEQSETVCPFVTRDKLAYMIGGGLVSYGINKIVYDKTGDVIKAAIWGTFAPPVLMLCIQGGISIFSNSKMDWCPVATTQIGAFGVSLGCVLKTEDVKKFLSKNK